MVNAARRHRSGAAGFAFRDQHRTFGVAREGDEQRSVDGGRDVAQLVGRGAGRIGSPAAKLISAEAANTRDRPVGPVLPRRRAGSTPTQTRGRPAPGAAAPSPAAAPVRTCSRRGRPPRPRRVRRASGASPPVGSTPRRWRDGPRGARRLAAPLRGRPATSLGTARPRIGGPGTARDTARGRVARDTSG